jgi:hypothetical protein
MSQWSQLFRLTYLAAADLAAAKAPDPPHHNSVLTTALAAVVAAIATAGLIVWALKLLVAPSLTRAGTGFASWLADHLAVLRSSSLRRIRRYQRSMAGYAAAHALGFGTEPISVRDVYVPLHRETAAGTGSGSAAVAGREDLYELVRRAGCTVVVGEAGAGKSMLLKHSLQEWSDRRTDRRAQIPVLIELRRLNALDAAGIDLVAQVTEFLTTNRYKGAAGFVPKALEDGRLSLLFDGLDEVTADRLDRVVVLLRDFAQRYSGCQVVVTCRTSLYRGELQFGTVIQVAELDDATIRRLLSRWPGLDYAAQERLYRSLGTNSTLKRLARSPLMLSMMAWLTAAQITLPTSRVEFYDVAIEALVRRDDVLHRGRSQFAPNKKLAVLRGLALLLQDRAGTDGDRLSFSHAEALDHIRSVATSIDLDPKDAEPILKEIADRTELLVATGGVAPRYFFRHLTFQEYLAAVELRDDRDGLLARYDRDHNAWREAVILWCGKADRDATPLIRELMNRPAAAERVLALECAAATTKVDEATVSAIVDQLLPILSWREQTVVAFGDAAAGSGPRSALIRGRLVKAVHDSSLSMVNRSSAMRALAISGHESAADFLADLATTDVLARQSLRSMGDLAVPSLAARAAADDADAIDDLAEIGTPHAIETLLGLLDGTGPGARRVAWRLGCRVGDSAFAAAVRRRGAPVAGQPPQEPYQWIWRPFSDEPAVVTTVARIAELIRDSADDEMPDDLGPLDFRLVLALAVVIRSEGYWLGQREVEGHVRAAMGDPPSTAPLRQAFAKLGVLPGPTAEMVELRTWLFEGYHLNDKQCSMISSLAWADQVRALRALVLHARQRHWSRAAFRRSERRIRVLAISARVGIGLALVSAVPLAMLALGFWRAEALLVFLPLVASFALTIFELFEAVRINPAHQAIAESATATASTSIIPGP